MPSVDCQGNVVNGETAAAVAWRTPGKCDTGACVEVGFLNDTVLLRDSADQDGKYLAMRRGEWRSFVARVKNGAFGGP